MKAQLNRKAGFRLLFCLVLVLLILPVSAYADIGPKPSVNITFTGIEGVEYCGTLLSESTQTYGPYEALDDPEVTDWDWWGNDEVQAVPWKDAFLDYQDPDGFHLMSWCCDCTPDNQLVWNYWPPETFKVLLYFPEEDVFCVSPIYERYAYDSYYTADLSDYGSGTLTLEKDYDYTWEMISLVVRIVLTIALELGLAALVFGWKDQRTFRFLAVVNIATQLFLNGALNALNYFTGLSSLFGFHTWPFYGLELLVMLVEGILYVKCLPRFSEKPRPTAVVIVYTIGANLLSMALGLWLATVIPGIF